jgi:hypothetical protein
MKMIYQTAAGWEGVAFQPRRFGGIELWCRNPRLGHLPLSRAKKMLCIIIIPQE